MWVARVENVESNLPVRVLRWATVEGLPSRGEVTFKENDTKGTTVELSVSTSVYSSFLYSALHTWLRVIFFGHKNLQNLVN